MTKKFEKLNLFIFAYWHDKGWKRFVGATVKIWDLAHNVAGLGHHVVLFLPKYHFPKEDIPFKLVQIPVLDFPFLRALSFNVFLTFFLIGHYFMLNPNVVYVRRGISIIPAIFAKFKKAMFLYEINDDPYPDRINFRSGLLSRLDGWIARKTDELSLSLCDAAFVITKQIGEKIVKKRRDVDQNKLHVLPSGTNTDLYQPLAQKECRLKLDLDASKKYIGFMGTLLDHQGVDVLIDAAPRVLQSIPNAVFVIMGEGPMKDKWRRRVEHLSLQEQFLFTGQVEYAETPLWINAMDVCTAPFLIKAGLRSPVKIFDYLACAKPVVASRISGTTDLFAGSDAVCLIEPENRDALARALVDLLKNVGKVTEMGLIGRKLVETHYNRRVLAQKIMDTAHALQNPEGNGPDPHHQRQTA
ncbi:MAG: glycosyltransferase family 4 protein [Deltaproteobacteria bacterium]|nr:glycosyltransferase family 4 protein [Deltaproteobacteria bacterium]